MHYFNCKKSFRWRSIPVAIGFVPSTKLFSSCQVLTPVGQFNILSKGHGFLGILAPRSNASNDRRKHISLVDEFLLSNSISLRKSPRETIWSRSNAKESSILVLFKIHHDGFKIYPELVSHTLSLCGSERASKAGIQIHCLAFVNGFVSNVYVGSSLITFYSKCCASDTAYKVFDEMGVKNIVSWTAMIDAFAQENRIDRCLLLHRDMRNSKLQPNDFTFRSFLTICTISGCLGQGRGVHCQTILTGFISYLHIANSLVSMYSKSGKVEDALCIFRDIENKDLVSWNSMIAGYAQHGYGSQAIDLFEEMKKNKVKPDGITFLAILSSCRHAGTVKQGKSFFKSMAEYGVKADLDHYSCIVDLFGRAGLVEEARDLISKMPISPNAITWGSLLSWCRLHGNVWIGIEAAENRLLLEPSCPATHLQLANMYAGIGYWEQAANVRKLMKEKGLKTDPGCSWIEIQNEVFEFRAEDKSRLNLIEILQIVDCLVDHMRSLGHLPNVLEEIDNHQEESCGSFL